jgi:hypothetical protein
MVYYIIKTSAPRYRRASRRFSSKQIVLVPSFSHLLFRPYLNDGISSDRYMTLVSRRSIIILLIDSSLYQWNQERPLAEGRHKAPGPKLAAGAAAACIRASCSRANVDFRFHSSMIHCIVLFLASTLQDASQ